MKGFKGTNQIVTTIHPPEARSKGHLGMRGSLSFSFVPPFLGWEPCAYFIGSDSRCQECLTPAFSLPSYCQLFSRAHPDCIRGRQLSDGIAPSQCRALFPSALSKVSIWVFRPCYPPCLTWSPESSRPLVPQLLPGSPSLIQLRSGGQSTRANWQCPGASHHLRREGDLLPRSDV